MIEYNKMATIELDINGKKYGLIIRTADTLHRVLRENLGLTGSKPGCENGDCGACTVLIDGWPVKSCIILAAEAVGHKVVTIEGLQDAPIQKAFIENWGFQCGYCTSGFIMNCQGLINIHPDADEEMIEEWLESNICRCTSYEEIRSAVKSVLNGMAQSIGE